MRTFRDLGEWQAYRRTFGARTVGFVPTMGALHEGHGTLLKRAASENEVAVLSIFVNPTQFNNASDLENYPVTLDADLAMAEASGISDVILPTAKALYPDQYTYRMIEADVSKSLCGAHRPGHFDGMLTVVLKLLNLVRPTRAYFGEKDFQQLALVQGMAQALFLETDVIACATVREADGLAMSSRNRRLDPFSRSKAPQFMRALQMAPTADEARAALQKDGFNVDYVEDWNGRRLGAVNMPTTDGDVRLIDNVRLKDV
jgi:pantoate--beta-alanine ligase